MWWVVSWCALPCMVGCATTKLADASFLCRLFSKISVEYKSPPTAKDCSGGNTASILLFEPSTKDNTAAPTKYSGGGMVSKVCIGTDGILP